MSNYITVGFRDGQTGIFMDEATVIVDSIKYINADSSKFQISPVTNEVISIRRIKK